MTRSFLSDGDLKFRPLFFYLFFAIIALALSILSATSFLRLGDRLRGTKRG